MTAAMLSEQLAPVVTRRSTNTLGNLDPDGLTAADIQYFGRSVLIGQKPSVVSAAITRALRAAGYKPTDRTVKSDIDAARGRRVLVWQKA